MAKKFYVVWVGRETGVFTTWSDTHKQVHQFPGAQYKSFPTQAEAKAAYAGLKKTAAPKVAAHFEVNIYCDGGCEPNPGKSGSGVAVYRDGQLDALWYGLYHPHGTNNTAELNALHESLRIAAEELGQGKTVQILCDSQYAINCVTVWAYAWKGKGWKRKTPGDIKNLEIIQQAHALYDSLSKDVVVAHVKAHMGVEGNELADRMSIFAIEQKDPLFCAYAKPIDIKAILSLRAG